MKDSDQPMYFVRINGKVLGPFSMLKLQALRDRGRIKGSHEISEDRVRWSPAAKVAGLFADAGAVEPHEMAFEPFGDHPRQGAGELWFYETDGQQQGPVGRDRLRALVASGAVARDDRAWTSGCDDWQPISDIPDLASAANDVRSEKSRSPRKRSRNASKGSKDGGTWDSILEGVRRIVTAEDLETICRTSINIGALAMTAGSIAAGVYLAALAVRLESLLLGLVAALAMIVFAALQHVGRRMCDAAHNLVKASSYRMSSAAFPDSYALVVLVAGSVTAILIAIGVESLWLTSGNESSIRHVVAAVMGLQCLLVSLFTTCCALHPEWMRIDCSEPVTAGEEGIGSKAFRLKLTLTSGPATYGLCAIGGALGMLAACVVLFVGKESTLASVGIAVAAGASMAFAVAQPLLMFRLGAMRSISLDLKQSILSIPKKIDELIGQRVSDSF